MTLEWSCPWYYSLRKSLDEFISLSNLGPVQPSNFTCAEPNTYLGRPKLLSATVDSNGRTLHVPNLINGQKKYHLYGLK